MAPAEARLALALAFAAPLALLAAAACVLAQRPVWWRRAVVLVALLCPLVDLGLIYLRWSDRLPPDFALFTWSPLGLYGVRFAVRLQPDGVLLMVPTVALAALGLWRRGPTGGASGLAATALALLAIAGALLAGIAGDLVSLYLAIALFTGATVGVLWAVAGARAAGHRAVAACVGGLGLLVCVLVLGEVNGLFQLAQLSTAGFTAAPFTGIVLAAVVAAPVPPFHGWLLRAARQPLAPALGVAGGAAALVLLATAFQVTAGGFTVGWERTLGGLGWLAAFVAAGTALSRRRARVRLAALVVGRAGVTLLAASVATPAAMAGGALYFLVVTPLTALLWITVQSTRSWESPPGGDRLAPARRPGFWLFALLVATAVGLPGTVGGAARGALVGSLTSWPSGDQLHRIPLLLLDGATLIASGSVLWRRAWFSALTGALGWGVVGLAAVLVVAPAVLPRLLIGSWFDLAAARAAGTAGSPLALSLSPVPSLIAGVTGVIALWALVQSLRGREWLPGITRILVGVIALAWSELGRAARRRGLGSAPTRTADSLQRGLETFVGRLMAPLRPLEERYYAAGAVMLAVALIYIIGR